jgi:23S rRNA pseudouridine1911/1915/1917 synthase
VAAGRLVKDSSRAPGDVAKTLKLRVPESAAGLRLDRFLAGLPEIGSRAAADSLLGSGDVRVDGVARRPSHRLTGAESLEVEVPEVEPALLTPEEVPLRVAYEDEHLLVVDKPAGVVVHPAPGHGSGTLVHGLLDRGAAGGEPDRPGIVHRLDRDTSGLLVVARSPEAHKRLQGLVRRRGLEREYIALVRGRPRSRRGRIEAPIGRDRSSPFRQSLDTKSPREAVSHFEVERLWPSHALLRVRLETGRTHQIRVHLAAIDLPVVGDTVYGVPEPELGRHFLHAARLAFPHPFTGEPVDVSAPLPPELDRFLSQLSK